MVKLMVRRYRPTEKPTECRISCHHRRDKKSEHEDSHGECMPVHSAPGLVNNARIEDNCLNVFLKSIQKCVHGENKVTSQINDYRSVIAIGARHMSAIFSRLL